MKNKVTQTMKKTSLFLVLFLLVLLANGQVNKISIGIIGSPDFYNYQFKSVPGFEHEYKTKINYSLGLSINYNFAENASVKTGLLFSTKGYILEYSWAIAEPNDPLIPQESNISVSYLDMPLLVSYDFLHLDNLSISVAPCLRYGLNTISDEVIESNPISDGANFGFFLNL
ncbi:MAG: outer membrane beta-barrel protein [Lentimicrobiaceae bacterium]|nr:outer membrane beta-barrel protein [Lentimicrobiaceae bacterium]